jgi:hypothetical protein
MSSKRLLLTALALAGAVTAGAAQAHDNVQWSVTVGTPVYGAPVPVYTQPAPVYGYGYGYGEVVPGVPYHHHAHYQAPTRWDRDGDGIPNRYDRLYNPAWDRDGDGIPNRYDRYDNRRHDRDGDRYTGWGR